MYINFFIPMFISNLSMKIINYLTPKQSLAGHLLFWDFVGG